MTINEEFISDEVYLRQLLRDEHDAIANYEKAVQNIMNKTVKEVIKSILEEEKVHVGELLEALNRLGVDDKDSIIDGRREAHDIIVSKDMATTFDRIMFMIDNIINAQE